MMRFARNSSGKDLKVVPVERPYSFFDFIERDFPASDPLHRIFSQVRVHGGQTMVVEQVDRADDLRQENEDIRKRHAGFSTSTTLRLSFFRSRITAPENLSKLKEEHFIGYALMKRDDIPGVGPQSRVYESVIRRAPYPHNYVRGEQAWECRVGKQLFQVPGYLYAQQNAVTNACAHVALRTAAARFRKDGDIPYREMNQLVGVDHVHRKAGGDDGGGLGTDEMIRILEAAGARCFVGDYSKARGRRVLPPFQKYLYGSIESGYPAIVVFGTRHGADTFHAIPMFGHTMNDDTWVPDADFSYFTIGGATRYIPSESWLSMFIGHDDNWGSNFYIPRYYLQAQRAARQGGRGFRISPESLAFVIGTFPKEVQVNSIRAEAIGADYLFTIHPQLPADGNPWSRRLVEFAGAKRLVLRPMLVEGAEYATHLARIRDWRENVIRPELVTALKKYLAGERLWMVELSVPNLFSANKRKVGEVLLRATVPSGPKRDLRSFVLARLPGNFALLDGGDARNPRYRFVPSGATDHVELYGCEERP